MFLKGPFNEFQPASSSSTYKPQSMNKRKRKNSSKQQTKKQKAEKRAQEQVLQGMEVMPGHTIKLPETDPLSNQKRLIKSLQLASKHTSFNIKYGKELGDGASSIVYLAQHKKTKIPAAVKIIPKNEENEEFMHEAKLIESLDHPNIIKIYETYECPEYMFIFMEYCSDDLLSVLLDCTYFSEQEARSLVRQLLSTVAYLHEIGVVHRDIKLENILLKKTNRNQYVVKLIDFGQSTRIKKSEFLTKACGSIFYISPEVLQGCYNQQCDVWSVGVVVYTILTGHYPFDDDDDRKIFQLIQKQTMYFTEQDRAHISKRGRKFIARMICRDLSKRWNASQLLRHRWLKE